MRIASTLFILLFGGSVATSSEAETSPELELNSANFTRVTNASGGDYLYLEYESAVNIDNRNSVIAELESSLPFIQAVAEQYGFTYVEIYAKKVDKTVGFFGVSKGVDLYLHRADNGDWAYGGAKY